VHEFISVNVISLEELFSDAYHFRLPYFQRAYAWNTVAAGRLLADVTTAMAADKPYYCLGKLTLAKSPKSPETALVDGHQRIMSLTILFAVLRDLEEDAAVKARLQSLIAGSVTRLSPQETIRDFLSELVQSPGTTDVEPEDDLSDLSETERNIIENRNHLRAELMSAEYGPDTRRALAQYLATRCCVIVSSVEDEDEAWQFLRTEEDTRVEFNATDRAKASLLSIIHQDERAQCQKYWETCEAILGAEDMIALLGHLRTLKLRRRTERPLEVDTAEIFKLDAPGKGLAFFREHVLPASRIVADLRKPAGVSGKPGSAIADYCERLNWIAPHLWMPAALFWLSKERSETDSLFFFKRLERLVWMMRIAGLDPAKQQTRIIQLVGEIERGVAPAAMRELEIPHAIRDAALTNLRSKTFDAKQYSARVLRRISATLGQDPGPVNATTVTVEHILPRGFAQKSGWRKHFPTKRVVQANSHKLGNLTFLTAADNQAADTLDWQDKRPIFARSKLVLANRLGVTGDWTAQSITSRTEDMIRILFEAWDLKP
jgi:hypothetical protein